MQLLIQKRGYRILPLLALVAALVVLALVTRDSSAVHNEGMLEMDGNVAYDGGDGFDPGTTNCPYNAASSLNAEDCIIDNSASFDWADVCDRTSGGALAGYITEAASLPSVPAGASIDDLICQPDFIIGATDDISYHTGSDKDFQEIGGSGAAFWHCTTSANATSKADLLNAYFIVATVNEAGVDHQVVYIGAERDSEHGSVFNGYWILQGDVSVPGATTTAGQTNCTPNAPLDFSGQHQCGDVLIRFNYDSGGRIGSVRTNEWVAPSPGVTYSPPFNAANGCDQIAGNADDCTAAQQASAETHTVPGGFLCDRPPAQGDCRSAADQTAPGEDLCGRVNGATTCTIAPKQNDPNPPPCSGPGEFTTEWEPGDGSPASATVAPPTFSEMGIDLTGLGLELPCIVTLIAESRSSPSVDATLKDFTMAPSGQGCGISVTKTPSVTDVCENRDTPVTYTYVVTNEGGTALTVNLVDDNGTPGVPGDDIDIDGGAGFSLAGHASQTFTSTRNINTTTTNTVTATGTVGGFTFSDTATAKVTSHTCEISIVKTTSPTNVCEGRDTPVTYTYVVTNNSDFYNVVIVVTDDVYGAVGTTGSLAPGVSATFTVVHNVNSSVTNVATAVGTFDDPESSTDTATDDAVVTSHVCDITIVKTASPTDVCEGRDSPVTYTYLVTNLSDFYDVTIIVTDDIYGAVGTITLGPGLSHTFTTTQTVNATITNVGTAVGTFTDQSSSTDTATDDAVVTSHVCDITIVKTASPTDVCAGRDSQVTYTYVVTNLSDFYDVTIVVTDDIYGAVGTVTLGPGESHTFTTTQTVNATVSNVATAVGTFTDTVSSTDTATDDAVVTSHVCEITIVKTASPTDVCAGRDSQVT